MYKLIRESTKFNLQILLILVAALGIVPLALGEKFKLEASRGQNDLCNADLFY